MEDEAKALGQRIRHYRKTAHLTQKELAEKLGIATGTLQRYELGKRRIPINKITEIANILNIFTIDLIKGIYTVGPEEQRKPIPGATILDALIGNGKKMENISNFLTILDYDIIEKEDCIEIKDKSENIIYTLKDSQYQTFLLNCADDLVWAARRRLAELEKNGK